MVEDFFSIRSIGDRINPSSFESRPESGVANAEAATENGGNHFGCKSFSRAAVSKGPPTTSAPVLSRYFKLVSR